VFDESVSAMCDGGGWEREECRGYIGGEGVECQGSKGWVDIEVYEE
jgi:hypothetical protein